MSQKTMVLVDGSSYLFRAYHGLPPLTSRAGEPTGAILGVLNMLRKLRAEYPTPRIAMVFDSGTPNHRHQLYADYKAHRPPMPEDLKKQIHPLHEIIRAMGVPVVICEGIEADDVIGTLARQAEQRNLAVIISTGDKDFAQLVSPHIQLVNTMTGQVLNEAGVKAKFGVEPQRMVDYLALMGDSVDNIPGIPNVGPKTAQKWLAQYGSLDEIVRRSEEIPGKVGIGLRENLDRLPLSRDLVTIRTDIALPVQLDDCLLGPENAETLIRYFERFGFNSWLTEQQQNKPVAPSIDVKIIQEEEAWQAFLQKLTQSSHFAVKTESVSTSAKEKIVGEAEAGEEGAESPKSSRKAVMLDELVGLSFALITGEVVYIPLSHLDSGAQLSLPSVLAALKTIFQLPGQQCIGHELKYELNLLYRYGIMLPESQFDTSLASYVLDNTRVKSDLSELSLSLLGLSVPELALGSGNKRKGVDQLPISEVAEVSGRQVQAALQLFHYFLPRLQQDPPLYRYFQEIEMAVMPVLASMERTGVLIDVPALQALSREFFAQTQQLEQQVYALAGKEFNLNSPKQLSVILFEELGYPILEKTSTGLPSTDEGTLQTLAVDYSLPRVILEYRRLKKLLSTYTEPLPACINPVTGRVHTSYNQSATNTGRLSSTQPNLQNIPIRALEGQKIRAAFIAPPGWKIISADYSQIELRIMAHMSGDKRLLSAFAQGEDVHRTTAAGLFGIEPEAVSAEQRRHAKTVNFGLIYGMSSFGLAKQLGIDQKVAQNYLTQYFERYPKVKSFIDSVRDNAKALGYVKTLWGRKLYFPGLRSGVAAQKKAAERAAINAPMQGSSAEIMKHAMILVAHHLPREARLLMQVHDELVLEVRADWVEKVVLIIRDNMMAAAHLSVPLIVNVQVADHW